MAHVHTSHFSVWAGTNQRIWQSKLLYLHLGYYTIAPIWKMFKKIVSSVAAAVRRWLMGLNTTTVKRNPLTMLDLKTAITAIADIVIDLT